MNDPVQTLLDEHTIISDALHTARQAASLIGKDDKLYARIVKQLIYFFRKYADGYHHKKEEDILFPEISKRRALLEGGIIMEMLENHDEFRKMVTLIEKFVDEGDNVRAQRVVERYTEAMFDHIGVENDELFHVSQVLMSQDELQKVYFKFKDADVEMGEKYKLELVELAKDIKLQLLKVAVA